MFDARFVCFFALFCLVSCGFDDLENFINPEDIDFLSGLFATTTTERSTDTTEVDYDSSIMPRISLGPSNFTAKSDCFGLGSIMSKFKWFLDLKPQHSKEIEVEFFFMSRKHKSRVQVYMGDQFGLEWTHFDPSKTTIVIVHGFLSYSNASWVVNMTKAFMEWDDVNVIAVDWSKGGKTWKYWRAVANTRTVGSDLASFLKQLMNETKITKDSIHFVGHSLGAHICAYAANILGGVRRITGLDPAQPCFITTDLNMLLDRSDADFVDVIHTNGRDLYKLGLGVPGACGDQDFYPNGGRKQPGCYIGKGSFFNKFLPISKSKMLRAICNHGRAYKLFTESLKKHNCSLIGHKWDLSNSTINTTISRPCDEESCSELGINADHFNATGAFYVVTTDKKPFCEIIPNAVINKNVDEKPLLAMRAMFETETTTTPSNNETSTTNKPKKRWFFF